MATAAQFTLSPRQEDSVRLYASKAHSLLLNQFSLRSHLEEIDRYYMREGDFTQENIRNRAASKLGDKRKMQDITVPIVMPQVESALGYMVNMWLTGYPIFGVAGDPSIEDAALQMETIIAENSITAGWGRQLIMFFRDGLKYNLHGIECEWQEKNVATIETDVMYPNSAKPKTTLWKGNVLRRMDLYNTFFDPRVHPSEIHSEGEFAGYIQMMSRVRMKKFFNDLYGKVAVPTVVRALESNLGGDQVSSLPFTYYAPQLNPSPLLERGNLQTFDWLAWASANDGNKSGIRYTNVYQVMKLYARIIPKDFEFRVPEENTPQVWKFIIVNGTVVVYAERCTNVHNNIPIFFGQPIEDGLDYQTKSFATNVADLQDVSSAMVNGYIASKRRLVGDRVLYDPLRVREKDINSTNPAAKIPVRPAAYGKPVQEAVYQFPYRDENQNTMLQGSETLVKMANIVNNQNPAQQGQFVKGNKTRHEYEDIQGHSNSRNQVMALESENQVMIPLKECVKLNILQYQPASVLYNQSRKQSVQIKPEDLRTAAVHFKVSDGMLPEDKQMGTEEFQMGVQMMGTSQALAAGYNMAPAFTYLMKLKGVDLSPFEKSPLQIQFEQMQAAWQNAAAMAAKAGVEFKQPQPQMPPELVKLLQAGPQASPQGTALESTTGSSPPAAMPMMPQKGMMPS